MKTNALGELDLIWCDVRYNIRRRDNYIKAAKLCGVSGIILSELITDVTSESTVVC